MTSPVVALLGMPQVGKTSYLNIVSNGEFKTTSPKPILDMRAVNLYKNLPEMKLYTTSDLDLCQEIKTDAFMVMFSFTDLESYKHVDSYINTLKHLNVPIIIVGNKTDVKQKNINLIKAMAKHKNLQYISAKSRMNWDEPIRQVYKELGYKEEGIYDYEADEDTEEYSSDSEDLMDE